MNEEQKERIYNKINEIRKTIWFKAAKNAFDRRKEIKNEKE